MGKKWDQGRNQKVPGNKWKWTHSSPKPMWHNEGSPQREVHSNTSLPKKDRNISNVQLNPTSIRNGETTTNKAQNELKEGNNQDQSRIKWHRD